MPGFPDHVVPHAFHFQEAPVEPEQEQDDHGADEPWRQCPEELAQAARPPLREKLDLAVIGARCATRRDGAEIYAAAARGGYDYGPAYRVIADVALVQATGNAAAPAYYVAFAAVLGLIGLAALQVGRPKAATAGVVEGPPPPSATNG